MNAKKGLQALSLLLIVALAGAMFVPAVSAESTESELSCNIVIQPATPPEVIVNIDEDAQYRESLLGFKEFLLQSKIDSKEYSEIIKLIDELLLNKEITRDEYVGLVNIVAPYMPDPDLKDSKWGGSIHQDMAYDAGIKMGLSSLNANILHEYADDADQLAPPLSSWNHYANTLGPSSAELYAGWAIDNINSDNEEQGYQDLAYALHFMSDMSMPFHDNYVSLIPHSAYEGYVSGNWGSGYYYDLTMTGFPYYYVVNDVSDSAEYLNVLASQYKSYIENQYYNNPNWESDPTLISDTRNCMEWASGYNRGLVKYVLDRT